MNLLLVLGLVVVSVVIVALLLRRGSGDAPGYRRRLTPRTDFRWRNEPSTDNSVVMLMPLMIQADSTHPGIDPGCTVPGHAGIDCGAPGGADGG